MTAIVGLVDRGEVWIGGDSAGVGGLSLSRRSDPKIFLNGECVFGYTSSFRMGQLLQYSLSIPAAMEGESKIEYMVRRFVPAVKQTLSSGGYERTINGQQEGGSFLVGRRGELYEIQDDYQVARCVDPFAAVGCGRDILLGSMHATSKTKMNPRERILLALEAAEAYSAGVRAPFAVLKCDKRRERI